MNIPQVHLPIKPGRKITKNNIHARAYPLNEIKSAHSIFDLQEKADRIKLIYRIVNYLDVESSRRYLPEGNKTFCNIYAYDITFLLGAYIPRVWWRKEFISSVISNPNILPDYTTNVEELNTKMLYQWLNKYGIDYSWKNATSFWQFKKEINKGTIGIICAISKSKLKSNHISITLPDRSTLNKYLGFFYQKINLSEAGRNNREIYFKKWWNTEDYNFQFFYLNLY